MKQHERTHKNRAENAGEKKSKAQATRDADKAKEAEGQEAATETQQPQAPKPAQMRKQSSGFSDPSDITLAPNPVDTPVDMNFFPDSNPQIVVPADTALDAAQNASSMYPPLGEEMLAATMAPSNEKLDIPAPQPPALVRGFSDLDTLAQAAESFDPYFQQGQF